MGLYFGAFDFILDPDGRYVFLEMNPFGQWVWIEQLCTLRIADSLVGLMRIATLRFGFMLQMSPKPIWNSSRATYWIT